MTLTAARRLKPIEDIAAQAQIPTQYVIPFGRHIAKIDHKALRELNGHTGRLIVVTSIKVGNAHPTLLPPRPLAELIDVDDDGNMTIL